MLSNIFCFETHKEKAYNLCKANPITKCFINRREDKGKHDKTSIRYGMKLCHHGTHAGTACPHTCGESLEIQIYPYVPHLCVLSTLHPDRDMALGKWLKHSSKHSKRMPGLASNYQLLSINPCTWKRPSNV